MDEESAPLAAFAMMGPLALRVTDPTFNPVYLASSGVQLVVFNALTRDDAP